MRILTSELVASIALIEARVEESELIAYEGSLDYILKTCSDEEIENITEADREELTLMHGDLVKIIKKRVLPEFWPDKFK